ncbi:MAG TPA: hypothetical protein QF665_06685 [Alphaproteobacteria bacterium]|jgi:hypothetical protein|nr:hypothetical protein [Alphaproteobacteria bacterium]
MPLSYLDREGLGLFVWCNGCFRNRVIASGPMIARMGRETPVPEVARRLRCSACGGRDIETRPDWSKGSPGVISRHT